ncbi:MAG: FIST N-terminal domain-containing protein [Parcubacteria group bacterium]
MAIKAGVGLSKNIMDPKSAATEATMVALERLGGEKPDFVIAFSSVAMDQEAVMRGINEVTNNAPMIGCSDAGEIVSDGPFTKSVAVMAIKSDSLVFTPGIGMDIKKGAREAGRSVARDVLSRSQSQLKSFIMLPDVLVGNGADVVRGVLDELGGHFPVVGGAAGDDFAFKKTYQYFNGKALSGAVVGAGLSGNFQFAIGVRHGWMPIGPSMKVTKSEGAVVHELNGRPAIGIYEDYFGDKASDLYKEPLARMAITYPLGIKVQGLDEYLIRDPITVDEKGAITCAAEIPEGSEVRLMIGSKEKAIEAAEGAARKLMSDLKEKNATPKFALMFNCIAREKLFGQKAKDEIKAVMKILGDIPLLGFYTYGEQAPLAGETLRPELVQSKFFNETVVIFVVGE